MIAHQGSLAPTVASFEKISEAQLNHYLRAWGHRMGPLHRPFAAPLCHGLLHYGEVVAVTAASSLIPAELCGLSRKDTLELSRLCACRPALCRVALRLWREFVLPESGYRYALSYHDEQLHTGRTYRFDGWKVLTRTRSGAERRSGARGRNKTVWYWDTAWATEGGGERHGQ